MHFGARHIGFADRAAVSAAAVRRAPVCVGRIGFISAIIA